MSGGLVCGKKCTAFLLGRSTRSVQALRIEVASHAASNSCPGMYPPWCMYDGRSMHAGVQRARSREVFGCEPVECMGAVYSRAGSRLSTRMQGECMGQEIRTWRGGYQHGYILEVRGKEGR